MDNFYRWLQKMAQRFGYDFEIKKLSADGFPPYIEPEFIELLKKYRDKTMVPWGGLHMAYTAARYVTLNQIPGAIVECGVWRGGCSLIMAEAIFNSSGPIYDFYLYDTFAGMTKPDRHDTSELCNAEEAYLRSRKSEDIVDWCYASIEEVSENIQRSPYPADRFHLVKGKVEDTLPGTCPEHIALLRIDTDWYSSTQHELLHLFPRLVKGGVFICDDYGFWEGARKAVREYLETLNEPFLLTVDSGSGRAIGVRI